MTFIDRGLVLAAVLSGVLATRGPVFGGPDPPAKCVDVCQQTSQYYDCAKKHAYEYELDDCYHCSAIGTGACLERTRIGIGACTPTDLPRKWRYVQDYTAVCPCQGWVTRVEIKDGKMLTDWDTFPNDTYYTCQPAR